MLVNVSKEANEKEINHPAHPMDRTANWRSHGGWYKRVQKLNPN
jgi:hypothetical protein